jgi:hypothetical protein
MGGKGEQQVAGFSVSMPRILAVANCILSRQAEAAVKYAFESIDHLDRLLVDCVLHLCRPPFVAKDRTTAFFLLRAVAAMQDNSSSADQPQDSAVLLYSGSDDLNAVLMEQLVIVPAGEQRILLHCASVLRITPDVLTSPPADVLQRKVSAQCAGLCKLWEDQTPDVENCAAAFATSIDVLLFFKEIHAAPPPTMITDWLRTLVQFKVFGSACPLSALVISCLIFFSVAFRSIQVPLPCHTNSATRTTKGRLSMIIAFARTLAWLKNAESVLGWKRALRNSL